MKKSTNHGTLIKMDEHGFEKQIKIMFHQSLSALIKVSKEVLKGGKARPVLRLSRNLMIGALAGTAMMGASLAQAASLNGAGSTFDNPIFSKWFYEYNKANGIQVNYQSIGSGGGIQQFISKTVDFGATDAFLTDSETAKVGGPALNLPVVMGAVCVSYNIPGVDSGLKLTADILTDIYMGAITKWNDPAIAELNSGVKLPDLSITVAHRSDGSGTTNIFTNYLTKVSAKWAAGPGWGKDVKWPMGVGGKGNEGVAGLVRQTPGAIGYVELAYAKQNRLPMALLRNKAGKLVEPTLASTTAAVAGAATLLGKDVRTPIVNSPAPDAWPISGLTFLLVYRDQKDPVKGRALAEFIRWAMRDGQGMVEALDYARLPESVVKVNEASLLRLTSGGRALLAGR